MQTRDLSRKCSATTSCTTATLIHEPPQTKTEDSDALYVTRTWSSAMSFEIRRMKPIVRQVTNSLGIVGGVAGQGTRHVAGRFVDLFVPWRWSQGIISDVLNAEDNARDELTKAFVETTLSGLEAIGLTVRPPSHLASLAKADRRPVRSCRRRHLQRLLLVQRATVSLVDKSALALRPRIRLHGHQRGWPVQRRSAPPTLFSERA